MGIIQIEPVTRTGMRFIISLYGMSETGKTLSALKLAAGLEPDPKKRGLLDTEGGQRGRMYAEDIPGGFMYGRLTPPFSPERYVEAFNEFEAAGLNVLVTDSVSHAWFAAGGVLDMVEEATETNKMARWKIPKRRLMKMTNRILSSDMHMILCSRGKQPMVDDGGGKYVPGPVVPIQEKGLRFDMTIMAQMLGDGRFTVGKPAGKCPGALRPIFASASEGGLMDETMGRKLADWIKGEDMKTPAIRHLEIAATMAADEGAAAFRQFWKELTPEQRAYLKPNLANYQSIALAADAEAKTQPEERPIEIVGSPFSVERIGNAVDRAIEDGESVLAQDAADEAEGPVERGKRLLLLCVEPNAVADLHATILDELPEDEKKPWADLCAARTETLKPSKGKK